MQTDMQAGAPAATPPFGRLVTAMVTPFTGDGARVDLDAAARLATYLVDVQRNDALVVNGTTGEAPTTSDDEKAALVRCVADTVGDRAKVLAGVGTSDTRHTCRLAAMAADAGADGLLVVAPYYSKAPQRGVAAHFVAVADATDLPVMVYDIPQRAAIQVETATLVELAQHPRIVAVKDAKGAPTASAQVMAATGLAYYAGDDAMLLPVLAVGGVGVVGTSTHFTGARTAEVIEAWVRGDAADALRRYRELLGVYTGVFATQGVMLVKAGLAARGFDRWPLRPPLVDATDAERDAFVACLDAAGL